MLSPVFQDTVFQHAVVPEGVQVHTVLNHTVFNNAVLNHPASISRPATTSRPASAPGRERPQDAVRLGVVLAELAAGYGLSEEPIVPAGVANLSPQSFEFAQAGLLPAMV